MPATSPTESGDSRNTPRVTAPQAFRGQALGLPASGPGSLAPFGRRVGAFLIDSIASTFVASLFVHRPDLPGAAAHLPGTWSLVPLALDYVLGVLLAGRTLGMMVTGLRVVRVDTQAPVGPVRAVVRTVLLLLFIPALLADRDFRGLHDRATATAVIVH